MDNINIPFHERSTVLKSGITLIWPFRNQAKGSGPYELHLDNNALIRGSWINELPDTLKGNVVLSPFHAFCEQWVSNPTFRENTAQRVNEILTPFINAGLSFERNYAEKLSLTLAKDDKALRAQWMLTYLYIVLLYRLVFANKDDKIPKQLLSTLKDKDVPMFNGCIMLCTLADYLTENKNIKLKGDNASAFSYISSFVALHTSSKNESSIDEDYLRNRAGDLSMWLSLPMLMHNNYQTAGEGVVVTQDKVLKKFIFRCLPAVLHSNGQMASSFDESCFESNHAQEIKRRIDLNKGQFNPTSDKKKQLKKMIRLRKHVLKEANPELVSAVRQTWKDWLAPGFCKKISV